jgi:hypothetical protein
MSNLIQLEKQLLAHDLQCADLPSILLLGEEDLSISTLSNLCKNLKIALTKTDSSLSEIGPLSSNIFLPDRIVGFFVGSRRFGEFRLEMSKSILSLSNVGEEVKVVIKEIWQLLAEDVYGNCHCLHN